MAKPPRPWHRLPAIFLGLAISAGFVHLLISKVDLSRVAGEIAGVDLAILSLLLPVSLLAFVAMAGRSAVLLRPLHRYRLLRLFKSVLVGFAGNNVLPLRMGEVLRIDYLARHGGLAHSSCLAVLAVERLLDLSCLVLLFFALLPLAVVELPGASAPVIAAAAVTVSFCGLLWIGRDPRRFVALCFRATGWMGRRIGRWVVAKARRFAAGLGALRSPVRLAAAVGLSWAYWLATMAGVRVVLAAFDLALPWYAPAVVVVFIAFGVALPSAPAFVGTYHYFAALALTVMAVEPESAVSVAVVQHAAGVVPLTALSLLLLMGEILPGARGQGVRSGTPGRRGR